MTISREEMIKREGSLPPVPKEGTFTWVINRASRSTTFVTTDGGETWIPKSTVWAAERARREEHALEQHRIQQELK